VLYPAGFPVRACAWGVDALIKGALILVPYIMVDLLGSPIGFWLLLLIHFGINCFYHVGWELFFNGQSPGKRIMGLRVVMGNGSPVTPGASFLRNLLRFADTFMFLYLIALVCMSVSRGFRRLGDWVADTLVVYTANIRPLYRLSGISPELSPAVSSRPLSYEEKQAILLFARRYELLGKARADEIARDYAAFLRGDGPEILSGGDYLLGIARGLSGER
jgi:uncharacterized RDD family membrane protein YckC